MNRPSVVVLPPWFDTRQAEYENDLLAHWAGSIDGAHDLGHVRRVLRNCLRIAQEDAMPLDFEVLLPAAIFHDLVNLPKDSPNRARASTLSAEKAGEILGSRHFPREKIPAVKHAIVAHSFSAGIAPESLEAKVLRDADRLDALGAVGVARTFYVAGRLDKQLYDLADPTGRTRELDDIRYALDHFPAKLLTLSGAMATPGGAAIAGRRASFLREFYDQLIAEIE